MTMQTETKRECENEDEIEDTIKDPLRSLNGKNTRCPSPSVTCLKCIFETTATITRQLLLQLQLRLSTWRQLAFQSRINLARFYDADHRQQQQQNVEYDELSTAQHAASTLNAAGMASAIPQPEEPRYI